MIKSKRGQAAGAAILLVVIAAFLVGFIVLIPPQERAELLGDDDTTTDGADDLEDIEDVEENLLTATPGRIDYLAQKEMEHPLPVVNIFTRTEARTLSEKNIAYVKNGVFSEETSALHLSVADLTHTENILLSFSIASISGRLIITLNGEEVFNGAMQEGNIQPIKLPKTILRENNEIIFSVSSPGVAFWATNEASLQNIKVIGEVTSIAAQRSQNIFLVSETERRNIEKMVLKFQPSCTYGEVGQLTITINGNEVYSAIPDCDLAMIPIEFSSGLVHQGENQIIFNTESGTYVLSHVVIESHLKEVDFPTYYFELSEEKYQDIMNGERRVRLKIDFVDVIVRKSGSLIFNGFIKNFDTKEVSLIVDLSEDVVRGNNAIKIKPSKTVEIRELTVDLVK